MDRGEHEDEQEALRGIVATLLALAVLAECLCVVPIRVRVLVLTLLRPAEAVTRAFAVELAGGPLAWPAVAARGADRDSSTEALRLAHCFRALASIVVSLQGSVAGRRRFRGEPNGRPERPAPAAPWWGHFIATRSAVASRGAARIDTS